MTDGSSGMEQVDQVSLVVDDAVLLPSHLCTVLCGPMGRGVSVLHLVLVPSKKLIPPLDDELVGHGS